jgi:hypothetical protein
MSKIFGFKPQSATQQQIEKFEDEVLIRHNNQQLMGTVYVDMSESRWAVAFGYNYSRKQGIHGHENPLEVRYSCPAQERTGVQMFRSDTESEKLLESEVFLDGDAFVRFALTQERAFAGRAA